MTISLNWATSPVGNRTDGAARWETFHTDMPLKTIFESRTAAALASMIAKEKSEDHESAPVDIEALLAQIIKSFA